MSLIEKLVLFIFSGFKKPDYVNKVKYDFPDNSSIKNDAKI